MAAEEFLAKKIQYLKGSVAASGREHRFDPRVVPGPSQVFTPLLGSARVAIQVAAAGEGCRDCTEAHSFHGSDGSVKLFIIKMIGRAYNSYAVARFKQGRYYHTANIVKKV